ncbi:hypothetical protein A2U01_0083398, partial [Trifolium medium]|nr:hypothetical protein [Trifolium medium]
RRRGRGEEYVRRCRGRCKSILGVVMQIDSWCCDANQNRLMVQRKSSFDGADETTMQR